jgi:hypothetical protein
MKVLALTIFVGLLLVGFFVFHWLAASCDPRQFNERDALLPLEDDDGTPRSRGALAPSRQHGATAPLLLDPPTHS